MLYWFGSISFRIFLSWLLQTPVIMNRLGRPQWVCYIRVWLYINKILDSVNLKLITDTIVKLRDPCVYFQILYLNDFFKCLTLVLVSYQASCSSLVMKMDFYKPTVFKVQPPISGITAHATMPGRLKYCISFCSMLLIKMNGAWKMVSSVKVLTHNLSVMSLLP